MPRYCQGSLPGAQLSNVLLKPKRETETASISPEGVLRQQTISNQTQKPVSLEAQSVCSMPSSHLHTSAHVCTRLYPFTDLYISCTRRGLVHLSEAQMED